MKIACVIHSLGPGGMERVMTNLANFFAGEENVQVHFILIGRKRDVFYALSPSVMLHKPDFKFNNHYRTWHTYKTSGFLRKTIKKIQPDVVLSFGELWNNLVLLSLIGLKVRIYISDRSQPGKDLGVAHNFLRSRLYPKAHGFIAQTTQAREVAHQRGWNSNIRVIGNPITQRTVPPYYTREDWVLSVGRLIRSKNFPHLIRMFSEINRPGWKLIIVGGNAKNQNNLEKLNTLIKELRMEESVILTGYQTDLESYYLKSKVFAFTSDSEGFPNVIGEALSYGVPVVSFDCNAGPRDLVKHNENGYLVALHDYHQFKQTLENLMVDEKERMRLSGNASNSIHQFNAENIGREYLQFITEGV